MYKEQFIKQLETIVNGLKENDIILHEESKIVRNHLNDTSKIEIEICYTDEKENKTMKALQDSIEHWKRMIEWVKMQDLKKHVDNFYMRDCLGEEWNTECCSLCTTFKLLIRGDYCSNCPLYLSGDKCTKENSTWMKVADSETWNEWLYNAKIMLAKLEYLLEKKINGQYYSEKVKETKTNISNIQIDLRDIVKVHLTEAGVTKLKKDRYLYDAPLGGKIQYYKPQFDIQVIDKGIVKLPLWGLIKIFEYELLSTSHYFVDDKIEIVNE